MGFFKDKKKKKQSPAELEQKVADIRHTLKNYLNMLTVAEFEKYYNNNITGDATKFIDSVITVENLFDQ